ncbi:putative phosphotransferase/anion transport protein [Raccoonpox virus]|uniref:Putative Phosphotransferase/anion transport protein n=1 Tax=Raccoon poxvirus TaxID=10256 RepID=A0A0G3FXV6_RACVI|nr:putative Phosphotransferase/anion transport protein [Raccoonpox virus]AKJ93800.1 putative Phosphotransferase/anion transport protein [Raccoonpox virus]AOP31432.1 putative phosphotransferase/anion transport protein [Raccoonpox virus]
MDDAYFTDDEDSLSKYIIDMDAELTSTTRLIIAELDNINNDTLNKDIIDFIMCESNLDNPFIAFLDTVHIIINKNAYQLMELINSLDDNEIIDCIVNKFINFYKDNLENIIETIITLKYIMNNPDFKNTYGEIIRHRITDIDIKQVILKDIIQLSKDIRERYL